MQILKNNGTPVQTPATQKRPQPPRGRDLADAAIRLRVYLARELKRQCEDAGLDADQCSSSAVTALAITLEKSGLRGIKEESDGIAL